MKTLELHPGTAILSCFFVTVLATLDPDPLIIRGNVSIGVLVDLHHGGCDEVSASALSQVAAVEWALKTINDQNGDIDVGARIYDGCSDEALQARQTLKLLRDSDLPQGRLLGVIGLEAPEFVASSAPFLSALGVPLVVTSSTAAHKMVVSDSVFTTAPHLKSLMQATAEALQGLLEDTAWSPRIGIVSSCKRATNMLEKILLRRGQRVHETIQIMASPLLGDDVIDFAITKIGYKGVIIMLLEASEIELLSAVLNEAAARKAKFKWIVATLSGEPLKGQMNVAQMAEVLHESYLVLPHTPVLAGMESDFLDSVKRNASVLMGTIRQYLQGASKCDDQAGRVVATSKEKTCAPPDVKAIVRSSSGTSVTAAIKAVSSLEAAYTLVQLDQCNGTHHCALQENTFRQEIIGALKKLSSPLDDEADRIHYAADGRLVTSFSINLIDNGKLVEIGVYKEGTGMTWNRRRFFKKMTPLQEAGLPTKIQVLPEKLISFVEEEENYIRSIFLPRHAYLGKTWAFSVLGLTCLGVVMSMYVTVYVLLRVCDGTINGPQVLGGLLLFGVIGVFVSSAVYVLPPGGFICSFRIWFPWLTLALCYSILLVKSMYLRSLVTLGVGGEVSRINQCLALFFMVGVQAVLCLASYRNARNHVTSSTSFAVLDPSGLLLCYHDKFSVVASQMYFLVLLLMNIVLSISNHKIRRNYNESHWLMLTCCVSAPIVCAWAAISFLSPMMFESPTASISLLLLAAVILLIIFVPKLIIIAKQIKDFRHRPLKGSSSSLSSVFSRLDLDQPSGNVFSSSPKLPQAVLPGPEDVFSIRLSPRNSAGSSPAGSTASYFRRIEKPQPVTFGGSPYNAKDSPTRNPIYHSRSSAYP